MATARGNGQEKDNESKRNKGLEWEDNRENKACRHYSLLRGLHRQTLKRIVHYFTLLFIGVETRTWQARFVFQQKSDKPVTWLLNWNLAQLDSKVGGQGWRAEFERGLKLWV